MDNFDNFDFGTEEDLLNLAYKRALQRQATPMPEFKSYGGGVYQLPGWGQMLGSAFEQARGARDEEATIAALRGLGQRRLAAQQAYLAQMPEAFTTQQSEIAGPPTPAQEGTGLGMQTQQVEKPLLQQAREWQQFGARGLTVPGMEKIGAMGLERAMRMPERMAEMEEKARVRAEELAARTEAAKEAARLRANETANQNAVTNVIRQQGVDIAQQRADIAKAEEDRKRAEADAKVAAGKTEAKEAKDNLDDILTDMQAKYDKLKETGGISSTERGSLPNAITALRTSGLGQTTGRVIGTEEQSIRDEIKSSRQQLLMAIAKRLGVKAGQLNSNVELQNWLNAITDPNRSYETNTNILNNLRKRYVEGVEGPATSPPVAPTNPSPTGPAYSPGRSSVLPQSRMNTGAPTVIRTGTRADGTRVQLMSNGEIRELQ